MIYSGLLATIALYGFLYTLDADGRSAFDYDRLRPIDTRGRRNLHLFTAAAAAAASGHSGSGGGGGSRQRAWQWHMNGNGVA
jgi:hypothetical protein